MFLNANSKQTDPAKMKTVLYEIHEVNSNPRIHDKEYLHMNKIMATRKYPPKYRAGEWISF